MLFSISRIGTPIREALGGDVYHDLNRGNSRAAFFHKDGDYEVFERVLAARQKQIDGVRLLDKKVLGLLTPFPRPATV
ncbi:MAG: hypothetical protein L0Y58_00320 [Verrucomicrobia subdivision 3 bacterium]|nr:hypothetical protein [Limisphaerales bacterium]